MTAGPTDETGVRDGREAAFRAVLGVLRGGGFAGDTLRGGRAARQLGGREAALATQIALGTIRHVLTIEHVLPAVGRFDRRRVRPELRAILYAAAYQIIWLDHVPVFAAVDEAVEQARRHVGGRAPAMVNAILRSLGRALAERRVPWQRLDPRQVRMSWDQACAFRQDVLPPLGSLDRVEEHLAAATGERIDRYRTLVSRFGAEAAEQVAWASQAVPVIVLQRNALRVGREEFQVGVRTACAARLQAVPRVAGVPSASRGDDVAQPAVRGGEVELTPDAAFLPHGTRLADIPLAGAGGIFVQDPTAHAAALLVGAQPGERVLDLCAAPGGKSITLAIQMGDRGEVVACDVSPERLARVRENIDRLGLTCVRTSAPPPVELGAVSSLGLFDAVLADVPCTNTGVIARRPEARLSFSPAKLKALVRAQQDLLRVAARHARPGGRLVYSTCSLEPEENGEQIAAFLAEHPDWALDWQQTTLPTWGPRLSDWRDGGYAARLGRR